MKGEGNSPGLRGSEALRSWVQVQSSFWDPAALNLRVWLNTVLKWGTYKCFLSLGGQRMSVGCPTLSTCALPPGVKDAWRTSQTCSWLLTRASSMKLCFQCGPTKQRVDGVTLLRSLFLDPVSVLEQLERRLQKGPIDQPKKERGSDVLFI